MGEMADFQMYEDPFDEGPIQEPPPVSYKTCRRCKKKGLVWIGKIKGRWVLGDPETMRVHRCFKF